MEPLRLYLGEDVALKVQKSPQTVKDEIESYHNKLIRQVQQFYHTKREELERFATNKINESTKLFEERHDKELAKPKSIVKRRPSRSDKRVSFSQSPPKVELFKKYEDEYEDTIIDGEYSDKDSFRMWQPVAATNKDPELKVSNKTQSEPLYRPKIKPAKPYYESNTKQSSSCDDETIQEELFDLEDILHAGPEVSSGDSAIEHALQGGKTEDGMDKLVAMDKSANQSKEDPPNDANDFMQESVAGSSIGSNDGFEASPRESLNVGSVPLDIKPNPNIVTYDGGPPQKTEALQKEEELEDESIFTPMSSFVNSQDGTIDPSKMSFSQRIEWEKFKKTSNNSKR